MFKVGDYVEVMTANWGPRQRGLRGHIISAQGGDGLVISIKYDKESCSRYGVRYGTTNSYYREDLQKVVSSMQDTRPYLEMVAGGLHD